MARAQEWLTTPVGRLTALALAVLIGLTSGLGVLASPASAAMQPRVPRGACFVGETAEQRIDNIIAILIGFKAADTILTLNDGPLDAFAKQCPGAAVLSYLGSENVASFLGASPDDLWTGYEDDGQSLTNLAEAGGVTRTDLLGFVSALYLDLLGLALADGVLTDAYGQRVNERVIPQFNWLIDYRRGDPVFVAAGDVNGDGLPDVIARCVAGDDPTERIDNLIGLMLGLPIMVDLGSGDDTISLECGSVEVIGILGQPGHPVVLTSLFGEAPEAAYEAYLTGEKSLLDIAEENGNDPVLTLDTWEHALKQELDAQVEAGRLSSGDRDQIEEVAHLIIVVCLKHYRGDPLPSEFAPPSPA